MRLYTQADYPAVCEWWQAWGWQPVPEHALPKIGAIIDGRAAAWLYQTDSSIAIIDWFITSKEKTGREEAKRAIIEGLSGIAKEQEYKAIMTFLRHPSLIKTHKESGFCVTDNNVCILTRSL